MNASQVRPLTMGQVVIMHLEVQAVSNILFGFSTVVALFRFLEFSWESIFRVGMLYLGIYSGIFIPFVAFLPVLFFGPSLRIVSKISAGGAVSKEEGRRTIERLLNDPLRISVLISVAAFGGFLLGVVFLRMGLVKEFMGTIDIITVAGIAIGFVVSTMHGLLNFVSLEGMVRPAIGLVSSALPELFATPLRITRLSLFSKILALTMFGTAAGIVSLLAIFLSKIAVSFSWGFNESIFYGTIFLILNFSFIFVLASRFSRNLILPLQQINQWSAKVIGGDSRAQNTIITTDELSDTAHNLNHMVQELKASRQALETQVAERTKELRALAENLEGEVREQTKELREKVSELEQFQRFAVGRELSMIDLKRRIRECKEHTEKKGRRVKSA